MRSVFFLSLMNGAAWGGSEELWFRAALWMCKNDYKVGIGCYDWAEKQDRIAALKNAGCSIYLLPNKKGFFKKVAVKKILNSIPFQEYGLTVLNQGGWKEILHAPFNNLYKKLPAYVILNHNYNENAVLSFTKQKLLQQWVSGAQMNFGATQKIFEVIERKFSISIDKKQTLVNPITFQPDLAAGHYPAFVNDSCVWVMLAELDTARKAQDVLINALSSAKWKERNWQLHLYGKGKDQERLEKLIVELGLEEKVILKGFTTNIKQTLLDCNLLLQCTLIDAMPLSVVEAMAGARPCVVSTVGDMPAWVEDGVNGFICPAVTVAGIDETMENCWQQKNNWAAMGKKAFETFTKKYPQPYEEKIADILSIYIR
ncbi:MAG: glycosyltransferase [Chitinophagaceae bacterium]|nr:glycosyltransferase [Chitinophagaceae bacterium]